MGYNRITAIDNTGVIPSLIEHAHIQTQNICHIDGTAHTALVGADDHHVSGIDLKILHML